MKANGISKRKPLQTDMIMPWGKYKGKKISTLSHGYVSTLLENVKITDLKLRSALEIQCGIKYKELQGKIRWSQAGADFDEFYDDDYGDGLDFGDFC